MTEQDTQLLRRLGGIAQAADPVPPLTRELGRAAFTLRRLDSELAELAELVDDSAVSLAGVRSAGSDARLLTFHADELVVEAQVTGAGDRLVLLGQVMQVETPKATVRLEAADLSRADVELDDLGAFRFDGIPAGTVRLVVELPGGRSVATPWFSL